MKYNFSFYNIIVEESDDCVFLYNTFSGAFAKLEKAIYDYIAKAEYIDDNQPCPYFNELLKQGFIKPVELNEFNKIITYERQAIYDSNESKLALVIAPTLACILNCYYCFEKNYQNKHFMSQETVMAILKYIKNRIKPITKEVHITWFGGEPLMAYKQIVSMSEKLISDLQKYGVTYTASMITNGVLLDAEKAEFLTEKCALKSIQITIDGTEKVYCKQKGATPKQFAKVLDNIKEAIKHMKVIIRFNCGTDNYDDIVDVAKEIIEYCGTSDNLKFYLAKLVDYSCQCERGFFTQSEFDLKVIEFNQYICELLKKEYKPKLPKYRRSFCGQYKLKNLVIGPDGEFYKCEHNLGREDKVIGNVYQGLFYTDELLEFLRNDFPKRCKQCQLFPLCLGGCPSQKRVLKEGTTCCISQEYIVYILRTLIHKERIIN